MRLGLNSTNSSRPPSSDPSKLKRTPRQRSGRRQGGQPGHRGHSRSLVPVDRVNATHDIYPDSCRHCGSTISEDECKDIEPLRHQIAEIPAIVATVTEYRRHRCRCSQCGRVSVASLPAELPQGNFGPNLRALLVVLSGRFRLSRRETTEFCGEALGLAISVGCIDNMCQGVGESLGAPVEEVAKEIQSAPVVHADESGWRQRGARYWIWVTVTATLALYVIAQSRGSLVVQAMLGAGFQGDLITDRWSAYMYIEASRRQLCWAHLKRDFQAFEDRGGAARAFGTEGLRLTGALFSIWHRFQSAAISRGEMQALMALVEIRVGELLQDGLASSDKKVPGFCKKLLPLEPALFLFSRVPGVEPTNNRAERALRPIVLWRKGSFGTSSAQGSRFVERMMTVVMTCRLQGRSVLTYLRDVCLAQDRGKRAPSLLGKRPRERPKMGAATTARKPRRKAG